MSKGEEINITDKELEILRILWEKETATVKEVHEVLAAEGTTGYTTTLKQMQLMLEKGLLSRDDSQRQHLYQPAIAQKKVQRRFMDKLMDTFFNGSASELVMQALGHYKTSDKELKQIRQLIDKAKKSGK